jgi:hypothetical protein
MITAYTLMYINSLNDLLYTSYRVKSMSIPKKKKIQLNPIHCIFQGSLLFGFVSLPGHLSVVLTQDYKQKGHDPSRSGGKHPGPVSPPSPSPAHFSLATLWRGEREALLGPYSQINLWPAGHNLHNSPTPLTGPAEVS